MNRKISRRDFNLSCTAAGLGATSLGAAVGFQPRFAHANWDTIAEFGGLATAAYGRLRINRRKP